MNVDYTAVAIEHLNNIHKLTIQQQETIHAIRAAIDQLQESYLQQVRLHESERAVSQQAPAEGQLHSERPDVQQR